MKVVYTTTIITLQSSLKGNTANWEDIHRIMRPVLETVRVAKQPSHQCRPDYFDVVLFGVELPGGGVGNARRTVWGQSMYRLTALSLKQRSVVILATVLIALMGIFGMTRLKTELLPDINIPVLTVITTYQGADPNAVDTAISQPVAAQVQGLPGIKTVQTQSSSRTIS